MPFATRSENYNTAPIGCQSRKVTAFYGVESLKKQYHSGKDLKHLTKDALCCLI